MYEKVFYTVEEEVKLKEELKVPEQPKIDVEENLDNYVNVRRRLKYMFDHCTKEEYDLNFPENGLWHLLVQYCKDYELLYLGDVGKANVERLYPDIN